MLSRVFHEFRENVYCYNKVIMQYEHDEYGDESYWCTLVSAS